MNYQFQTIKKSPITALFIAINVLPFLAVQLLGNYIFDGFYMPDSWSWSKVYTLLTPSLIHFDVLHLIANMILIWIFGCGIETLNRKLLITLIFTSAAVSNLAQFLYNDAAFGNVFGGASGVAFALFGYFLVESYLPKFITHFNDEPRLFIQPWLSILLVIYLFAGFSGQIGNIANIAHLSGLIFGASCAAILILWKPAKIR